MGRSQLTTTQIVNQLISDFGDFRRALMSRTEQHAFDQLYAVVKNNRLAVSQAKEVLPVDSAQMMMLVDLQRQIDQLRQAIEQDGGI